MTDVALRQWFVRCGSIPARFDISFIMLSSVVEPRGALQNQILSSVGLNFLHLLVSETEHLTLD